LEETKVHLSLLEFSLKDGMQVHLKSECFTSESRPNKDFTRDSLNKQFVFGVAYNKSKKKQNKK
jgi:hypothetical protein